MLNLVPRDPIVQVDWVQFQYVCPYYVHACLYEKCQPFNCTDKMCATVWEEKSQRPTRIFSAVEDPESHQTSIRMVAIEYQREIPPFFIDPDGNNVNVFGIWQQGEEHFPCPRDYTNNIVLVMTNRGIFLFCYDCGEFYPEGGRWGYKTSLASFEQSKRKVHPNADRKIVARRS